MIFISEERERTSTLDSKRVREEHMGGEEENREHMMTDERRGDGD